MKNFFGFDTHNTNAFMILMANLLLELEILEDIQHYLQVH